MEIAPRVTVEPNVAHGAPVIAGTRVPVSIVIGSLADGMSNEEVMREYQLSREDIRAALCCRPGRENRSRTFSRSSMS